jgi:hypothetical protein
MSKFTILSAAAAITLAGIGLAHADEEAPRSRAEVIAELDAARSSGELDALVAEDSGSAWLAQQVQPSSLTRQQVLADVKEAQQRGEMTALVGEDSGSVFLSMHGHSSGLLYAGPNIGPVDLDPGLVATAAT